MVLSGRRIILNIYWAFDACVRKCAKNLGFSRDFPVYLHCYLRESKGGPRRGALASAMASAGTDFPSVSPPLQTGIRPAFTWLLWGLEGRIQVTLKPDHRSTLQRCSRSEKIEESAPHIRHSSRRREHTLSLGGTKSLVILAQFQWIKWCGTCIAATVDWVGAGEGVFPGSGL